MSLFSAQGLVKRFGGLLATDHVDLAVEAGEIHALIGPNGAGKSTLVNLISGLLSADAGRIVLDGTELTTLAPHQRSRHGLARCFQITSVFRNDSVRDNLVLAVQAHAGSSFRCLARRDAEHALQQRAEALAQRVGLTEVLERNAGTLAHGVQKRLDVALALASQPKLLLLDEPMAGMNVEEKQDMCRFILDVNDQFGTTIVLIEHDMGVVMDISDRVVVLDYGKKIGDGAPDEVRNNEDVISAYLGTSH